MTILYKVCPAQAEGSSLFCIPQLVYCTPSPPTVHPQPVLCRVVTSSFTYFNKNLLPDEGCSRTISLLNFSSLNEDKTEVSQKIYGKPKVTSFLKMA